MDKFSDRAYNCDNREIFSDLPDDSIDMILTDPPYKDYQSNRPVANPKVARIDGDDFDIPYFLEQSSRVLKPGRHFYCWCDHLTFPGIVQELYSLATAKKKQRSGHYLDYRNCLVWVKNNHGSGDLKSWAPQHEFILFASKGKPLPLNGNRPSNVLFKREDGRITFYKKVANQKYKHGTSKPVDILKLLIEVSTLPGDLVFDPYAGSMSTADACIATDRRYLMVEINSDFYEVGLRRVAV